MRIVFSRKGFTPRFAIGAVVRIPHVTPGHDRHKPKDAHRVHKVYAGADARSTHYQMEGEPSLWPETRLAAR